MIFITLFSFIGLFIICILLCIIGYNIIIKKQNQNNDALSDKEAGEYGTTNYNILTD